MRKLVKGIAVTGLAALMIGTCAFAGTSYESYNTTVGKFNGSGYSDYQTKTTSGANGYIKSKKVGGDYVVDVRMNGLGNGSWVRNLTDGTNKSLPGHYKQTKGSDVRVKFSNDITTPVNVQVSGTWKSN